MTTQLTEIDEKEFQHAVCLYLQKKLGSTNEKEISTIASTFGVNLSSPCNFNVDCLIKKSEEVDEGLEKKFQDYITLLVERKYFGNLEEGSDEYKKRLQTARDRFFAKFQKPVDPISQMTKEQRAEEAEKHKDRANTLLKERKWQEAVDEYTTALKYCETSIIYANRAVPYGKMSQFQEAISDCKKSIALDPSYLKGHMRLGYMYFQIKDYKSAIAAYKQGLIHDPTNETLQNDLAKAQSLINSGAVNTAPQGGGMPGMPGMDMSALQNMMQGMGMGGGGGGEDGMGANGQLPGNFMEMMTNPQFMQAAQQFMMGDPQLMQWAQNVSQNPEVVQQILQGKVPEGMPMPDNMEEMMSNMPPQMMQNFAGLQGMNFPGGTPFGKKEDKDGDGGIGGM
jgi:hypothetical protein